jgi:hypothetical protein
MITGVSKWLGKIYSGTEMPDRISNEGTNENKFSVH